MGKGIGRFCSHFALGTNGCGVGLTVTQWFSTFFCPFPLHEFSIFVWTPFILFPNPTLPKKVKINVEENFFCFITNFA